MQAPKIKLSFLPKDKNYWRIDWFGEVNYRSPSVRNSTPSILVSLSQWPDANLDAERIRNASGLRYCQAYVPVGYLGKVKLGDVWRNGEFVASPQYQIEHFTDLSIDRASTGIIKAGQCKELPNTKIYYLPFNVHPYHSSFTGSCCLMVNLPNEKRLIVPAVELIRFYFGSSSGLINALFQVPLTQNKLWSYAKFAYGRNNSKIILAPGMSGWSVAHIARMAFDSNAWHAAKLVGNSLSADKVYKQPRYPRTHFPFEGKTTLKASGIWLPFGEDPKGTFLVFRILSCSHPFPFYGLSYDMLGRAGNSGGFKNKASDPTQTDENPQNTPVVAKRSSKNNVEEDPSKSLGSVEVMTENELSFPDLAGKFVRRMIEPEELETQKQLVEGIPISAASTGTGGMADDIRPVDLVRHSEEGKQVSEPNLLMRELVDDLSASGRFDRIELVCEEPRSEYDRFSIYMSFCDAFSRNCENMESLLPSLSDIQVASVTYKQFKAFLLIGETNLPSNLSPLCVAILPNSANKSLDIADSIAAALDAISGLNTEGAPAPSFQYFIPMPDSILDGDLSVTVRHLSQQVEKVLPCASDSRHLTA